MSRKPDHPCLDRSKINDSGVCWHRLKIYPFLKLGLELPCSGIYHGDAFVSLESYRVHMSAVRDMRYFIDYEMISYLRRGGHPAAINGRKMLGA